MTHIRTHTHTYTDYDVFCELMMKTGLPKPTRDEFFAFKIANIGEECIMTR